MSITIDVQSYKDKIKDLKEVIRELQKDQLTLLQDLMKISEENRSLQLHIAGLKKKLKNPNVDDNSEIKYNTPIIKEVNYTAPLVGKERRQKEIDSLSSKQRNPNQQKRLDSLLKLQKETE